MALVTDIRNYPSRDGTSQKQRTKAPLSPDSIEIDARTLEDFLVFTQRFAKQIIYKNHNKPRSEEKDTWEKFFNQTSTLVIAAIQSNRPDDVKTDIANRLSAASRQIATLDQYLALYDILGAILEVPVQIENWRSSLSNTSSFKNRIEQLIKANLTGYIDLISLFEDQLFNRTPINQSLRAETHIQRTHLLARFKVKLSGANAIWFSPQDTALFSLASPFGSPSPEQLEDLGSEQIQDELETVRLNLQTAFTVVYNVYFELIRQAPEFFNESLSASDHPPHQALLISFIKLYDLVRQDINTLTRKHLDFFYESVLHIKPLEAVPDSIHLFFELAKQATEHKIAENTPVDAGPDESGETRIYDVDQDLVANKTSIASFRTVFVEPRTPDAIVNPENDTQRVFAAPIANSLGGDGTEFEDVDFPSWPTLGSSNSPLADIGFLLASNEFLLSQGTRTITLTFSFADPLPDEADSMRFAIQMSTAEGWFPEEPRIIEPKANSGDNQLIYSTELAPEDPPIAGTSPDVLEVDYGTQKPLLRAFLVQELANKTNYHILRELNLSSITVDVKAKGLADLVTYSDLSLLDPNSSFLPFGPSPHIGSNFFVGHREAIQKSLQTMSINVEWENMPANFTPHYEAYGVSLNDASFRVDCSYLPPAPLESKPPEEKGLFNENKDRALGERPSILTFTFGTEFFEQHRPFTALELERYGLLDKYGFVQFSLKEDFLHDRYPVVLAQQLLAAGMYPDTIAPDSYVYGPNQTITIDGTGVTKPGPPPIPNEPYTPTIKSISAAYTSQATYTDNSVNSTLSFYHLHPFGFKQVDLSNPNDTTNILPKFVDEGTLYLGLSNFIPGQGLSILFQHSEGTADADIDAAEIDWQYLVGNQWKEIESFRIVEEATDGFVKSGIISFGLAKDIDTNHTVMPSGLSWLKASTLKNASAVSELINAHPQAVKATFDAETLTAEGAQPLKIRRYNLTY